MPLASRKSLSNPLLGKQRISLGFVAVAQRAPHVPSTSVSSVSYRLSPWIELGFVFQHRATENTESKENRDGIALGRPSTIPG